ncbi:ketosteroid isomerase-related protein [Nisaea sp.]|uniref:ketosteroid isomerase-related protein n=1 Tax=Nisaea sp. TaxID=2024842 RepID=UPI0032982895
MSANSQSAAAALVQRYYDAFNAADVPGMLACLSDDVTHDVNQGGRRSGKALFGEFCGYMERCYKEQLTDIVVMPSSDGSRVAAEFTVNGTYLSDDEGLPPATGQSYTLPAGTFFDIADGKISRVTTYYNLEDWIAQVTGKAA